MEKVIFWSLLILCDILSQGSGVVFHDKTGKVITGSIPNITVEDIERVPYIVNIHLNGSFTCGGSLVESNIVITAAHCVEDKGIYVVYSGSVEVRSGIKYHVDKIEMHPGYHKKNFNDDLALVKIHRTDPNTSLHIPSRHIPIYNNHVSTLMRTLHGTVSGWGCAGLKCKMGKCFPGKSNYPKTLRSFQVVTVEKFTCERIFGGGITDKNICTKHESIEKIFCGDGDSGGPLVVNGQLLGILSWGVEDMKKEVPDVFMNLAHPHYYEWIRNTMSILRN